MLLGPIGAGPDLKEQTTRRHTRPIRTIPRLPKLVRFNPVDEKSMNIKLQRILSTVRDRSLYRSTIFTATGSSPGSRSGFVR